MSAAEAYLEDYELTLTKLASDQLASCKGNQTKAIAQLTEILLKHENRHLLKELVAEVVLRAVRYSVAHVSKTQRAAIVDPSHGKAQVTALARGLAGAFLDWPLPGGKRLADANRSEVMEGSRDYELKGTTMLQRSRWLRLVAQTIPEDKVAGDVLTNERLTELWQESTNDRV